MPRFEIDDDGLSVDTLVDWLEQASDSEIVAIESAAKGERHKRALESGDLGAVIEEAFENAFGSDGMATAPYVSQGVIVCPGSRVNKTQASHKCRFVSVGDEWVWQAGELLLDDMRMLRSAKGGTQSVSLLALVEDLVLDVVTSRARGPEHTMIKAESYKVVNGQLIKGPTRTKSVRADHR